MTIQAIILCGGKGERLRPLTNKTPKPMIKIKGKAILDYIIEYIFNYGIKKIIVATGYQSKKIENHINKKYAKYDILISDSGSVDIIERIKNVSHLIKGDFILMYGDTLSNVNIDEIIKFHNSHPGKVTMTVWPFKTQYGLVKVDSNGIISSFKEKPKLDQWINIGYFYIENEILSLINKFNKFEIFLEELIIRGQLYGYKHTGTHITVNTIKELEEAEKNIHEI